MVRRAALAGWQSNLPAPGDRLRGLAWSVGVVWSVMRNYYGVYHRMSPNHLDRYVDEFSGRHKVHCTDTVDLMSDVARGIVGRRLCYRDLIKPNGRPASARELAR